MYKNEYSLTKNCIYASVLHKYYYTYANVHMYNNDNKDSILKKKKRKNMDQCILLGDNAFKESSFRE